MINKIILLLFILGLSSFQTPEKMPVKNSDYFNVMAGSGLRMRGTPNLKGKKIMVIPYNAQIEKINDGKSYGTLSVKEFKGFNIEGEWVKVKYKNQEGFVFSGYLTQFPLPISYDSYFKKTLKVSKKKYDKKKYKECTVTKKEDCICNWKEDYYDGNVTYEYGYCSEEALFESYTFRNVTFAEAYLIGKKLFFTERKQKFDNHISYDIKYSKSDESIYVEEINQEAGSFTTTIKKIEENIYLIENISSC